MVTFEKTERLSKAICVCLHADSFEQIGDALKAVMGGMSSVVHYLPDPLPDAADVSVLEIYVAGKLVYAIKPPERKG